MSTTRGAVDEHPSGGGERRARLVAGAVGPTLLRLAIPMFFGLMSVILFHAVDTYFVSKLGTVPLAAMSFTFPVVMLLGSLAIGLGTGATSVISRAIGSGQSSRVRRLTSDALVLALLVVVFFVAVGLMTIDPVFRALGASDAELPLIREYMTVWYFGMVCLVVPLVGNSAIRATGDTRTPALIMVCAAGLNFLLDPLLIFGLGPFPRLELAGAAIATVMARALALVASLLVLGLRERMLTLKPPRMGEVLQSWSEILRVGAPTAATNMLVPLSMAAVTGLVATYGKEAVAAFGAGGRLEALVMMATIAVGTALAPFVGQNWGAGHRARVRRAIQLSHRFTLLWGVGCWGVLYLLARQVAGVFSDDPAVIEPLVLYLTVVPIGAGLQGITMVTSASFNAINRPSRSAILIALRVFGLFVPLAYLGSWLLGLKGLFGGMALANILAGVLAWRWGRRIGSSQKVQGEGPRESGHPA